jgi:hypothetical protein
MKCNQCGFEVVEHGKFCPKCGHPLVIVEQNEKIVLNIKRKVSPLAYIGLCLGILGFLLAFFWPFITFVLCLIAVVFSIIALKDKKTIPIIAIVITILALCLALVSMVVKAAFNEIQNSQFEDPEKHIVTELEKENEIEIKEYIKDKKYKLEYPSNWILDDTTDDFNIRHTDNDATFELVNVTSILGPIIVNDQLDLKHADTYVRDMYAEMLGDTVIWNEISDFAPLGTKQKMYSKSLDYQVPDGTTFGRIFMLISEESNAMVSFILITNNQAKLTTAKSDTLSILESLYLFVLYDNELYESLDELSELSGLKVNEDNVSKISSSGSDLLGRWKDTYNNSTLEFLEDNTVIKYRDYPNLDNHYSGEWSYSKEELMLTFRIKKMVIDNVEEADVVDLFFVIKDFDIDHLELINLSDHKISSYIKDDELN